MNRIFALLATIIHLISILSLSGCAIKNDSYLVPSKSVDGIKEFRYIIGAHLLDAKVRSDNIDEETAIIDLLENSLKENNFCTNGYLIERTVISRGSDITVYGKCTK